MEIDMLIQNGLMLGALMVFLGSLSPVVGPFFRNYRPSAFRLAARFGRRLPALFRESDDFYCFFHKDALYGE